MKCLGVNYHWNSKPCPNHGHVDGYCYLHHPEVVLAKLNYQLRAGRVVYRPAAPDRNLRSQICEQEKLLAEAIQRRST